MLASIIKVYLASIVHVLKGVMALWFVCWTLNQAVQVQAWDEKIEFCSQTTQGTFSTQVLQIGTGEFNVEGDNPLID